MNIPDYLTKTKIGKFLPDELEKIQLQIKEILTKQYGANSDMFWITDN